MKRSAIIIGIIIGIINISISEASVETESDTACQELVKIEQDSLQFDYSDFYRNVNSLKLSKFLKMYDFLNVRKSEEINQAAKELSSNDESAEARTNTYKHRIDHIFDEKPIEVIQNMVNEKEALIDIFVCDSCTHVFIVTSDTFALARVDIPLDTLKAWTKAITNPLYFATDITQLNFNVDLLCITL